MIPTSNMVLSTTVTVQPAAAQPTNTYRIDFERGRVLGRVDGREAMVQAISKILQTERFDYLIYSWRYGSELKAMLGRSRSVLESELRRVIREALLQDSRITDVSSFSISYPMPRTAHAYFIATTIFGEVNSEVTVNV